MHIVRRPHLRLTRRVLIPALLGAVLAAGLASPALATPAAINLNSSACPADIASGEDDGCVVELQILLNDHGFGLTVDGDFGAHSLAAVRTFQSETGIAVDGIVGPQTKAELYVSSTSVADPIDLRGSECPATVEEGQTGGCATELQDLLNEHGAHLSVDGDFGANTLAAVESFQSAHGLGVDGEVGPLTKAALYGSTATPGSAINLLSAQCPANITEGEDDGCVTTLQSLLDAHGASLSVDGDFGASTLAAVESFQSAHGLGVDGRVGPLTKAALYASVSTATGAPAPLALESSSCPANISEGEDDGCVTTLQSYLNSWGAHLSVDGDFGAHTFAAVEAFQSANGLGADGIVGSGTKSVIYNDGVYHCPSTGCPGQGTPIQSYVIADAKAIVATGTEPYSYGGGHRTTPGPSLGECIAPDDGYYKGICYGATTTGVDCSGFTRWMYAEAADYDALGSGDTNAQISQGIAVTLSNAIPGDPVFFGLSSSNTDHVGIYAGTVGGVPMMYDAFTTGTNVQEQPVSDADNSSHPLIGYYHYNIDVSVSA